MQQLVMRRAAPADREGIIQLINAVFEEYGDRVCLGGADADLLDVAAHYGRGFVVLERDGEIVGTHAVAPLNGPCCTFRRLYLHADLRGSVWGERLMRWALRWAERSGYRRVEFWSDVRFTRAHRFFRRLGFQHDGRVREMNDAFETYEEYFFFLDLPP